MVKYFTQEELAVHNNPENCWVVIFDKVYDISELIMANRGPLSNPLIEAGGSSISHWFNEKTGDLKTYIDPVRNIEMFYTPCGRFIHVPPPDPVDRTEIVALPWWKDTKYIIGQVRCGRKMFFVALCRVCCMKYMSSVFTCYWIIDTPINLSLVHLCYYR